VLNNLHLRDATKDVYPAVTILTCCCCCCSQYVQKAVDGAASAEGISKVDAELTALKHKVAGELIGARYLPPLRAVSNYYTARERRLSGGASQLVDVCFVVRKTGVVSVGSARSIAELCALPTTTHILQRPCLYNLHLQDPIVNALNSFSSATLHLQVSVDHGSPGGRQLGAVGPAGGQRGAPDHRVEEGHHQAADPHTGPVQVRDYKLGSCVVARSLSLLLVDVMNITSLVDFLTRCGIH
jgi:hypothetical protein